MPQSVVRLETSKFENNIGKNKLEYVKKSQKTGRKNAGKISGLQNVRTVYTKSKSNVLVGVEFNAPLNTI